MTAKELRRRKQIVRSIIGSHELEGVVLGESTKRILRGYAKGELSATDLRKRLLKTEAGNED